MYPVQVQSKSFQLPQGNLAALTNVHSAGQQDVLAIHGWLDNAASFVPLMEHLPNVNLTAIDLPGHGHSFHRPPHCYYHFIDWVSDLVALISTHFTPPITIIGHSLGGMLATVLSGLYPELVNKLILIDAAGLFIQEPTDGAQQLREALDSRTFNTKQQKVFAIDAAIKARLSAGDISQSAASLLVHRSCMAVEGGYQWRSDKRLRSRSPIRLSESQAFDVIKHIDADTLICLAEQGYASIKQNYQKFQHCYQQHTAITVPGHHHCHMDNPQDIALAIRQFITKV